MSGLFLFSVTPAKAGAQPEPGLVVMDWVPAFAGMTNMDFGS